MKKIALVLISLILFSCGTSAVVKEATQTKKGDWLLTSITYPGNEQDLDVTLFNDVPSECLENSSWIFRSGNNTGSFEPTGISCSSGPHFFIWSITEMDATAERYDLMFKPTDADFESTMNDKGYRINLVTLTADQMVWEQTINFEGQPFTIRMNFNK